MATAKKKRSSGKPAAARRGTRRHPASKRLTPSRSKRGLEAGEVALDLATPEVAPLVERIREAGGAALAAYREPLAGRPILLAALPISAVEPTPFQRDLSPTHAKKLAKKIEESGSFLDPLIVVQGADGRLWTPNGRHRLAAAKVLGLRVVLALVSPDEGLAFRILALNTEKAHNLKDRSLEAIRMARALAEREPRAAESTFAEQLEEAALLTLGLVYEQDRRFAGGAYGPVLRKVDRFTNDSLRVALRKREGYAGRLLEIDAEVKRIVAALASRGFRSPYLRSYVVARINPVRLPARRRSNEPPMALGAALTRMSSAAKRFDPTSVRPGELALVAAIAPEPAE